MRSFGAAAGNRSLPTTHSRVVLANSVATQSTYLSAGDAHLPGKMASGEGRLGVQMTYGAPARRAAYLQLPHLPWSVVALAIRQLAPAEPKPAPGTALTAIRLLISCDHEDIRVMYYHGFLIPAVQWRRH